MTYSAPQMAIRREKRRAEAVVASTPGVARNHVINRFMGALAR